MIHPTALRRKRKTLIGLMVCIAGFLLCISQVAFAATMTLLEDNFDNENGGMGQTNFSTFTNWNVTNGSVDLLGNGFVDFYPGNGLYLDLDGSTSHAGRLESKNTFSFNPNDQIILTFDLAGPCATTSPICSEFPNQNEGDNAVTVVLGSLYQETFVRDFDDPFQTVTRMVSSDASTTGTLFFAHASGGDNGGDNIGLILDNVRLTKESSTPVPEPSTLGLFISGLVCLELFRRRKKL